MKRFFSLIAALLLLACAVPTLVAAQSVPPIMVFQGRLAKPDGTPVGDVSSQPLTFRLYSAPTGGTKLWEQSGAPPVRNGAFAARFDFATGYQNGATLASVFNGAPIYLEVQVGNDAPLVPRQLLASNAYAFTALNALSVAAGSVGLNALASGVLNFANLSGTISAGQIDSGSITGDKLASGTITGDKIANKTIGPGNLGPALQQTLGNFNPAYSLTLIGSVGTGFAPYCIAVSSNYAYVVNYGNNILQTFDVSNPASPVLKASVATGDTPLSVAVSGNYAYVGNYHDSSLQVFDVSNPAVPTPKGSVGTDLAPRSVAVSGNYAYVVNNASNSLQVFDLSVPANPVFKGRIGTGASPVSVAVSGSYAYVVNYLDNSLQVFDVSNPTAPTLKGSIETGAHPGSVALSDSTAYVVNNGSNSLQVFDVSVPTAPTLKGSTGTDAVPYCVAVSGSAAYVVNYGNNSLQVFDVSVPANPVFKGRVGTGIHPSFVAASGNIAYVVNEAASSLQIFQLSGVVVTGNLTSTGSLVVDSNGTNSGALLPGLLFGNPTSGEGIVSKRTVGGNQYGLDFYTGATSRLSIASNGNVGIGTITPAYKLDVNGTANISGNASVGGALSAASATIPSLNGNVSVGGNVSSSRANISSGTIQKGGATVVTTTDLGLYSSDPGWMRFATNNGPINFFTNYANGIAASPNTPQVSITAGGDVKVAGQVFANGVQLTSDARYKAHIVPFSNALDTVLGLRGVTFDWNRDLWQSKNFPSGRQVGFIAQEVESVLPELVTTDANGYKSVAYQNVVPVLVEAVKTLKKQNDAKDAEIASMKARLDTIERLLLSRKP